MLEDLDKIEDGCLPITTTINDEPEQELLPVTELCANTKFPCVMEISENSRELSSQLYPYLECPLLAYAHWKDTIVKCRTKTKMIDGSCQDVGPALFIPSTYKGLFEIILDNGKRSHYTSIAEIAEIMPSKLFTCTSLVGMSIVEKEGGKNKYIQKSVVAGSNVTIDSIFVARWKSEAVTGLFKKTKVNYTLAEKKYLKCLDYNNEVLYLPFSAEGRFYAFYEPKKSNRHIAYRINEISNEFEFPLKVRLIYGTSPVRNVKFTDVLTLYEEKEKEMIIACPVGRDKHCLIDIPIKDDIYVKLHDIQNVTECNEPSLKFALTFSRKYVSQYKHRIREIMEYGEADDHNTFNKQDGNKLPLDLLKDLNTVKKDVKISISNLIDSTNI
ncbi:uncharacterized protein LOC115214239 [Argonauta hians]